MEIRAYIKNVNVTPKKLRFLLPEVKKMKPQEALDKLLYVEKKPARLLYKAIQSAIQNAKNVLKADVGNLVFKTLAIEEGQKLKRYNAGGRGNVKPFVRRYAHIKVVLGVEKSKEAVKPPVKELPPRKSTEVKEVKKAQAPAPKKRPSVKK